MQTISSADIMTAKTERDGHEPECTKKRTFFKVGKMNFHR
jgi:hypothetical protein